MQNAMPGRITSPWFFVDETEKECIQPEEKPAEETARENGIKVVPIEKPVPPVAKPENTVPEKWKCSACQKELESYMRFCPYCGKEMASSHAEVTSSAAASRKGLWNRLFGKDK